MSQETSDQQTSPFGSMNPEQAALNSVMESCAAKTALSSVAGFGMVFSCLNSGRSIWHVYEQCRLQSAISISGYEYEAADGFHP